MAIVFNWFRLWDHLYGLSDHLPHKGLADMERLIAYWSTVLEGEKLGPFSKEKIEETIAALKQQPNHSFPNPIIGEQIDPEIAQLFRFYSVESMFNLVKAQARHIEKLQEKLLAVNRIISHERPINSGRHG